MCGILATIDIKGKISQDVFEKALFKLNHRGPDDFGCETYDALNGNEVKLGHTRLSIIDLSRSGHQPMSTRDGRLTIVFNGEIYNYKEIREELKKKAYVFTTETDTEVLLNAFHCWGIDCLKKIVGMFAFVVLDRVNNKLVLVRDAFGIKPLYYAFKDKSLICASEIGAISALLKDKPKPDFQSAYDYLVHGEYDSSERTFIDGIKTLRPSSYIEYDLITNILSSPKRWWTPVIKENKNIIFEEAVKKVRELFLESVKLHLRSDVPIGAALSGGVDSSSIVCAMRFLEPSQPIHTFSYIAKGTNKSEEKWVNIVNEFIGAIPHKVTANSEDLLGDLEVLIKAQGEPFSTPSIYAQYRVFKEAKEQGIIVMLEGQGADELLAGYSGYPGERIQSLLEENKPLKAFRFLNNWSKYPGRKKLQGLLYFGIKLLPKFAFRVARGFMGRSFEPNWINIHYLKKQGVLTFENRAALTSENKGRRVIERLSSSLMNRGLSSLLRHGDRNSMHFSIESRVPFLTIELAEFLYSLPEEYLISLSGETKSIFRQAMKNIVPMEILCRKDKIGFDPASENWKSLYLREILDICQNHKFSFMFNQKKLNNLTEPQLWRILNYLIFSSGDFQLNDH